MSSPSRNRRNRQNLIIVIGISFVLHLVGLLVVGGMTIYQMVQEPEAEFVAPPEPPVETQPVKVSLKNLKQSSMPKKLITV